MHPRLFPVMLALVCLCATRAAGATFPVLNTNDNLTGSLRQAIQDAAPGDTIVFQIPTTGPGYNSDTGVFTINLTSGQLLFGKNLTIDGGRQKITVRRNTAAGTPNFRIFQITSGNVTISGLTISDGNTDNSDGLSGGGIRNVGADLTLVNCTVANNNGFFGGGILNSAGSLLVNGCTFRGNTGGTGAGIFSANNASLTIKDSTFFGNSSGAADGGAINNQGALTVTNSTITGNTTVGGGGGVWTSVPARVRNTIIAGNNSTGGASSVDVFGSFVSDGYNFIGVFNNQATGFGNSGSHDQIGTTAIPANPSLGPLQANGGPTQTRRPLTGSPLIDQGDSGGVTRDQRGFPRPVDQPAIANAGDGSDIGAVEVGLPQTGPTFTVTNTLEQDLGSCRADSCSLLEALNATNSNADANTINFAADLVGKITTATTPNGLGILNPVTINGPGARVLAVSGENAARIFQVFSSNVAISGLTIRSGFVAGNGGGLIVVNGNATLTDCTISLNNTDVSGTSGFGGGLYNSLGATLSLVRCSVFGNSAPTAGGGVYNDGTFTATNCTFTSNASLNGGGITSRFQNGAPSSVLRNCTISDNRAISALTTSGEGGGGIYAEGGAQQFRLANTIVAGNFSNSNPQTNPDVRGNFSSDGHNFIGIVGNATGLTNSVNGDQVGNGAAPKNPMFGFYANNGGPTDTFALTSASTAINNGDNNFAPLTDQRGYFRSGVSDIGAYEYNGTPPPAIPLVSVVSRKTHAGAGVFDILLPGIECRSGGATGNYTVVFTFTNPLTNVGTAGLTSGSGNVSSSGIGADPRQYIVNLDAVANAQTLILSLTNVTDSLASHSDVVTVSIGVLLGDSNGTGTVNVGDTVQVRSRSGQPVDATNYRQDFNLDGTINSGDTVIVRTRSGTAIP